MKTNGRSTRPTVYPAPCPKLFERSFATMIQMTMFTTGMSISRIHHHGRPTTFRSTSVFQIGMMAFQPASPAFWNTIQRPMIARTTIAT